MYESESNVYQEDDSIGLPEINLLIADLVNEDWTVRLRARRSLVAIGREAIVPLIEALASRNRWLRWEGAMALRDIGDPMAAPALVIALEDHEFDVRWLAADGLVVMGREALMPLLRALIERPHDVWLMEGAHHVLGHTVGRDIRSEHHAADHPAQEDLELAEMLIPVVDALEGLGPSLEVPLAARAALNRLTRIAEY